MGKRKHGKKKSAKAVLRKFFRNTGRQVNKHAIKPIGRAFKGRAKKELKRIVSEMTSKIGNA